MVYQIRVKSQSAAELGKVLIWILAYKALSRFTCVWDKR